MELKAYTNFPVEWGHLLILKSYVECWWLSRNYSEKIWDCVGKIQLSEIMTISRWRQQVYAQDSI